MPAFAAEPPAVTSDQMRVDFGSAVGRVRPLHGVNGGPLCRGETIDLTGQWRTLNVPLTRLHDCEWPRPDLVDMHAVFPDSAADPEDPASYEFGKTDSYVAAAIKSGAGIVYRLGESIEHTKTKYHVHPPADPERWASACVGVVRHFNDGWADGHRYGIRYWEVWNEPENRPACWTGTDEDYYRLYAVTAKAIKQRFPELKVGGPSTGAIGEIIDGELVPTPFVAGFLRHCRENRLPLDFFSWHLYTNEPSEYAIKAAAVRRWLDKQGFQNTEIHLNEWNYLPDNSWMPLLAEGQGTKRREWHARMGGAEGAAFIAYVLCDLQDAPVDVANLFRGDAGDFGLFDSYGTPQKTFHAFRAFGMLLETPRRVRSENQAATRTAICAGLNDDNTAATVLITNAASESRHLELSVNGLPWTGSTSCEQYVLDERRDLEQVELQRWAMPPAGVTIELPAHSVAVLRLRRNDDRPREPK